MTTFILEIPLPRLWWEGMKGRGLSASGTLASKLIPLPFFLAHQGRGITRVERSI